MFRLSRSLLHSHSGGRRCFGSWQRVYAPVSVWFVSPIRRTARTVFWTVRDRQRRFVASFWAMTIGERIATSVATTSLMLVILFNPYSMSTMTLLRPLRRKPAASYLPRSDLENEFLGSLDVPKILVLYGNKGCGKTTLWETTLRWHSGVVEVVLNGQEDHAQIRAKVIRALSGPASDLTIGDDISFVTNAFLRFEKVFRRLPILVFNVQCPNHGPGPNFRGWLSKIAKLYSTDRKACIAVLDISLLSLGSKLRERSRSRLLRVKRFDEAEALEFLDGQIVWKNEKSKSSNVEYTSRIKLWSDEKPLKFSAQNPEHVSMARSEIFEQIGRTPLLLENVLNEGLAFAVEEEVSYARDCVEEFVSDKPKVIPVLRKLAESESNREAGSSEGAAMDEAAFSNAMGLAEVAEVSKLAMKYKVVQCDPAPHRMEIRSVALRNAIKELPEQV